MLCTKCAKTVPDESQFCPFCGTELGRAAVPAPAPPPETTVPLQSQQPQPSGSGALIAVLVAVVFVFLVLGGIGAYIVIKKLGPKPPADVGGTSATEMPATAGPTTETTGETPATDSSTAGGAASEEEGGSAASGISLDALVGEWQVDIAQLDGPPPTALTIRRNGDKVVGTLNDRINTHLDLAVVNGEYEGTWTDPQVGTVAAEALLMPEGTLEIFVLDGSGGADLLISAYRGRGSSQTGEGL